MQEVLRLLTKIIKISRCIIKILFLNRQFCLIQIMQRKFLDFFSRMLVKFDTLQHGIFRIADNSLQFGITIIRSHSFYQCIHANASNFGSKNSAWKSTQFHKLTQ